MCGVQTEKEHNSSWRKIRKREQDFDNKMTTMGSILSFLLLLTTLLPSARAAVGPDGICRGVCVEPDGECTFTVKVDLFASELGHFQFEECNGALHPTIGIELGRTYRFIQEDRSNFYHPMGFAYYPDGAHNDVDELEPGIAPPGATDASCAETMTCPAPMYFQDNGYLGTYSNNPDVVNVTVGEENFGLDDYEPKFFHPVSEWVGYGPFSVTLRFDDRFDGFQGDLFYFCHIHSTMVGRIKLLRNNVAIQPLINTPPLEFEYPPEPAAFDLNHGTYGLEAFQLPHPECPQEFVCRTSEASDSVKKYADAIDAMNCAMTVGMTTHLPSTTRYPNQGHGEFALFVQQMIPHHQNAVNMAKALLQTGVMQCEDLTDDSTLDCIMEQIMRDIINGQNAQIQTMQAVWEELDGMVDQGNVSANDHDCKVKITELNSASSSGFATATMGVILIYAIILIL